MGETSAIVATHAASKSAKPHMPVAILHNGVDPVVCQTIGRGEGLPFRITPRCVMADAAETGANPDRVIFINKKFPIFDCISAQGTVANQFKPVFKKFI